MRLPSYTGQFKRDVKLAEKRGKDLGKLRDVGGLNMADKPKAPLRPTGIMPTFG